MKYLFVLCLHPLLCCGEPTLPIDTAYLLFDQQSEDSLCSFFYVDVNVPKEALIKKYRKQIEKDEEGNIRQITFHICNEEFIYNPQYNTIDTLSYASLNELKLSNLEEAFQSVRAIEDSLNANADKRQSIYVYPKYMLLLTIIIEVTQDQKLIQYSTGWVEKIE